MLICYECTCTYQYMYTPYLSLSEDVWSPLLLSALLCDGHWDVQLQPGRGGGVQVAVHDGPQLALQHVSSRVRVVQLLQCGNKQSMQLYMSV